MFFNFTSTEAFLMNIKNSSIKLLLFASFLFVLSSCDSNDPDPMPPAIGGTIEVEGGRGTDVEVGVSLRAETGIQSLSVSVEGGAAQTLEVTPGAINQAIAFPFSIPADATVGTSWSMVFTMTDQEGDTQTFDAMVIVGNLIDPPETYEFTRDEMSTVSFPDPQARLDQLTEMVAYLGTADAGGAITEQALLDMFANTGNNGGGNFSFTSDLQLMDRTFAADLSSNLFADFFSDAAIASTAGSMGTIAADGTAGILTREVEETTFIVDANGRAVTQLIEKGLMGAVLYNEIYNTYLTDNLIGESIENVSLSVGNNYTEAENNIDQAFGYFGAPVDFASDWPEARETEATFWSKYSNIIDAVDEDALNLNDDVMEDYIATRAAIVNNDPPLRIAHRDSLYGHLEMVAAAAAVHFINDAVAALDAGNQNEALYAISNVWGFVNALRYNPVSSMSPTAIETILGTNLGAGGNFWDADAASLNAAKATLVSNYTGLTDLQDSL